MIQKMNIDINEAKPSWQTVLEVPHHQPEKIMWASGSFKQYEGTAFSLSGILHSIFCHYADKSVIPIRDLRKPLRTLQCASWYELIWIATRAARLEPFQRSAGPTAAKETLYNAKQLCQHASLTIVNKYNKYLTVLHVCPALVVVLWCTHLFPIKFNVHIHTLCVLVNNCIVYCIYACVVLHKWC